METHPTCSDGRPRCPTNSSLWAAPMTLEM